MRTSALSLIFPVAVLLIARASAEDATNQPPPNAAEVSAKRVQELQKERMETLKAIADTAFRLCENGQLSVEEGVEANLLLFKAELDMTENESERLAVCKTILDRLNQYEEIAVARQKAARGTSLSVLKVKALRLEIEIKLERAKAMIAQGAE